jgi:hypothetical protein
VAIWTNSNNNYSVFFPLALQPDSGLGRLHDTFLFTSVTRSRTIGRTPWWGDQLVARPLPVYKHRKMHTQHTHYKSKPRVEYEPTVPASARAKTVYALDRSATVTGNYSINPIIALLILISQRIVVLDSWYWRWLTRVQFDLRTLRWTKKCIFLNLWHIDSWIPKQELPWIRTFRLHRERG